MINTVNITTTSGTETLTFGTYAIRRFCKIIGCGNSPRVIINQLEADTLLDSLVALLQSGLEATYAKNGKPFTMTEYQICELADALTEPVANDISYAFIGSVLGVPATEVPGLILANKDVEVPESPNEVTLPETAGQAGSE